MPLQSLHPIYVNFGVPQQDISRIRLGHGVRVTSADIAFNGRVTAIEPIVEQTTRNVQVQATLDNPKGELRPGMFVQTELSLGAARAVVALPASAMSYAPFGDSVFIVSDMRAEDGKSYRGVRQQFVKLGGSRGDQVAIVSGVKAGEEVVTSGVFKLRNAAAVVVNNKAQPANQALTTLNIYSQVGLITLVGLIAKNGILIVEFANHLQETGKDKVFAVIEAAGMRLRPILMTTAATVVGRFPLITASGPGAGARNSIGIMLVSGMIIGTVFTLFVLPSIYVLVARTHTGEVDESEEEAPSIDAHGGPKEPLA